MKYLAFFIFLTQVASLFSANKDERPNFIFIMMDDLGYSQVSWNSERITEEDYDPLFLQYTRETADFSPEQALEFSRKATPTLSRMAKQGILFTNAFTSSNLCAPSRMAIATGILQNRWGVYRNIDAEARGPNPGSLLVEQLQEAGYATAHIGKWHIGRREQAMVAEAMERHGIQAVNGQYPSTYRIPEVNEELEEMGYYGSCVPEHHPLNNGYDYYYGYNHWASPFYNATNVWEGFKHVASNPKYNTDLFTDKAIDFIEKSIKKQAPFFIQLHYHAVHGPLEPKAPGSYYNRFDSSSFILNNFYAHVFGVDENVRRLENFLKDKNLADNTVFVFTSDNGGSIGGRSTMPGNAPYRGHKGMYLMGGIKVPLFFYWPKGIPRAMENDQLVSAMDIMPTLLSAAGIAPPDDIDGRSLVPYFREGTEKPVRDHLVWSGIHARTWGFMSRTCINPEEVSRDDAPFAWVVIKDGLLLRHVGTTIPDYYKDLPDGRPPYAELYNIQMDPGERNNLISDKPEAARQLRALWEQEAATFPPPFKIGMEKWQEIAPGRN